jgi:hypothetical protein
VTGSSQAALEARASGAKVIFLNTGNNSLYSIDVLEKYGILILDGFDSDALRTLLERSVSETGMLLHPYNESSLWQKI